jgi:hypothetical protein
VRHDAAAASAILSVHGRSHLALTRKDWAQSVERSLLMTVFMFATASSFIVIFAAALALPTVVAFAANEVMRRRHRWPRVPRQVPSLLRSTLVGLPQRPDS